MSKRGSNRQLGAPALPGAGRPPQTATIRAGNPVCAALTHDGGYELLGTGTVTIERVGTDRIVRIPFGDGSTLVLTVF